MRLDQGIEVPEKRAAAEVYALADALQDALYYSDETHPPETVKVLNRAWRVMKSATIYYRGEEHGLFYEAPSFKFKPKGTK